MFKLTQTRRGGPRTKFFLVGILLSILGMEVMGIHPEALFHAITEAAALSYQNLLVK